MLNIFSFFPQTLSKNTSLLVLAMILFLIIQSSWSLYKEVKVHILWEGHKILQNLHHTFVLVSSILKMVGPKMQEFCPRINMLKGIFLKTILWWIMVHQKVLKLYFQSKFSMSKIDRIFSRKIILTISI